MNSAVNKVSSLDIIVSMIDNEPYYEIKYKEVGEDHFCVGYSSYDLNNVLKWRDEYFDLVNEKMTNADKIRNMTDEELAEFLKEVKADYQWVNSDYPGCEDSMEWLDWLQSEAE